MNIKEKWKRRIHLEVSFWEGWLKNKGLDTPEDYNNRINPNSQLGGIILDYINPSLPKNKILDVGAGPLTTINKKCDLTELEIHAIDPLADEYGVLLEKIGITPIIRTQKLEGEELSKKYSAKTFDITYSTNAIDHSYDPLKIIREMIKITKTGGYIIIQVFIKEGSYSYWGGLHNWDFSTEDGSFFFREQTTRKFNISDLVSNSAKTTHISVDKDKREITVVFKKKYLPIRSDSFLKRIFKSRSKKAQPHL